MKLQPVLRRIACFLTLSVALSACLARAAGAQNSGKSLDQPAGISLSPAVIAVKTKPGQTFAQDLTLWNNTLQALSFQMEARDVVVRDGKRVFLPAGEAEGSIARYAVFTDQNVVAPPGSFVTTRVTVTVPSSPGPRAIACIFMGKTVMGMRQSVAMTGSLGALVTFTLTDDFQVQSKPPQVAVDMEAQTIAFRQNLKNTGSDPVVPKGVIAVTNESGSLVARLPVSGQRLLPGESLEFTVEHAGLLKTGKYRAMLMLEDESAFFSNAAEFAIK
jgi:hypothetical protein